MHTPSSSVAQDQWVEICGALRVYIAKMVEQLPAMKPDEVSSLVTAMDNAMWAEVKALSFDEYVEERRRTLERQAEYGG